MVEPDTVNVRGTKGSKTGKFMYEGDRPKRWTHENDVWVHGYWFWDWSDERQKVESIDTEKRIISVVPPFHGYGYRIGQWFYAMNILAELDAPGEWYLDRETGILYFWPPTPIEDGRAVVSVSDTLMSLTDVSHVALQGLILEVGRGTAVVMNGCEHTKIAACVLRNVGSVAVRIAGGRNNGVVSCDIYGTGSGGIVLRGGERSSLTVGGHFAENNHIHHYGRWNRMYTPAIAISGVGSRSLNHFPCRTPGFCLVISITHKTILMVRVSKSGFSSKLERARQRDSTILRRSVAFAGFLVSLNIFLERLLDDLGFVVFDKFKELFIEINIYNWHFKAKGDLSI